MLQDSLFTGVVEDQTVDGEQHVPLTRSGEAVVLITISNIWHSQRAPDARERITIGVTLPLRLILFLGFNKDLMTFAKLQYYSTSRLVIRLIE